MAFPAQEKAALLRVPGVGPTVVARLEQLGFASLRQLSQASVLDVVERAAALVGSSCWKNSPQARAAIQGAIALACERQAPSTVQSRTPQPGAVADGEA